MSDAATILRQEQGGGFPNADIMGWIMGFAITIRPILI
jgi:hypothetical protein